MVKTWTCRARVAAIAVGAVMAGLVGCTTPATPPPASGYYQDQARQVQHADPDARPWFCNAAGNGTPPSGHGNGSHVHPYYEDKKKGPLGWEDCLVLSRQLDGLWANLRAWDTRGKAEAAGWFAIGEYVEGLGTHHTRLVGNSLTFDTSKPNLLIFGGSDPDAPLVGAAWSAFGATPPAGFAGGNDWWHQHVKICFEANPTSFPPRDLGEAEQISDEQCEALGGRQVHIGEATWLLHLWLNPPYAYQLDMFSSGHNCLLAERVAPAGHPCWEIAHRDPALGMPPGVGGDHRGAGGHGH